MPTKTVAPALRPETPPADDILDPPIPGTLAATLEVMRRVPDGAAATGAVAPPEDPLAAAYAPQVALFAAACTEALDDLAAAATHHQMAIDRHLDAALLSMQKWGERVFTSSEHAEYSLAQALLAIQEKGLTVLTPPYGATIDVVSPAGFPVRLTIAKREAGELVEALPQLLAWLQQQGFTPGASR